MQRAANSITVNVHRHLSDEKLTVSQFGALEALYHLGPLTQKDLGRKILKTGGNITMVVDNLEKRNLVKRQRDTKDRRYVKIHLGSKGRKLIRRIFPRHVSEVVDALSSLSAREQEDLGNLCRKLGVNPSI